MRLVTYRADVCAAARLGVMTDLFVVDLEYLGAHVGKSFPNSMLELIDLGPQGLATARDVLKSFAGDWPSGTAWPTQNVKLLAPIPRPRRTSLALA